MLERACLRTQADKSANSQSQESKLSAFTTPKFVGVVSRNFHFSEKCMMKPFLFGAEIGLADCTRAEVGSDLLGPRKNNTDLKSNFLNNSYPKHASANEHRNDGIAQNCHSDPTIDKCQYQQRVVGPINYCGDSGAQKVEFTEGKKSTKKSFGKRPGTAENMMANTRKPGLFDSNLRKCQFVFDKER